VNITPITTEFSDIEESGGIIRNMYNMEDDRIIRIGEAAKMIGVRVETLREWDRLGKFKAIRTPGNSRMYRFSDIEKLLRNNYETI